MELNKEQIESLFRFTEKKFVHWYDLQTELVDHLASGIEDEMQKDPSMDFENALQKVYKGFGIMGFSRIIQEKQAQLNRAAKKMWVQEMKNILSWPRIIFVCFLAAVLWTLTDFIPSDILFQTFVIIYLSAGFFVFTFIKKDFKLKKKLLLLQYSGSVSTYIICFEIIVAIGFTFMSPVIFTVFCTIGLLFKYASYILYRRIKQKALQLYPEVFLDAK